MSIEATVLGVGAGYFRVVRYCSASPTVSRIGNAEQPEGPVSHGRVDNAPDVPPLRETDTMSRPESNLGRYHVAAVCLTATLAIAAACGTGQLTPTGSTGGQASAAPPITATPSPGGGSAAGPSDAAPGVATAIPGASLPATPVPADPAAVLPPVKISVSRVVAGLPRPIGVASAGDSRLFILDQAGKILIVKGGVVAGTFLDISARVATTGSERGLIGLAFHPRYASNGFFFVRYTVASGDVRISEFHVSPDPNKADPASEKVLITIPHRQFANHNGGTMAFGPDGYLYIGTGDGGGAGDPNNNGQNLKVLLGKMLRIDVDHSSTGLNYAIPATNPFVGQAGRRAEIWAYGLRNPYGFSFDRQTGDLWIGDVGQNLYEEIDRATHAAGLGRGANYGWSVMEATHCFKPASRCATAGKVLPMASYSHGAHDSNGCAVQGGFVYRGTAHPELAGRYFFGDYCSGKIWDLTAAGPSPQSIQLLLGSGLMITSWGQGADGELYVVATNGGLYHLV
jgi:glucose/arabinose dehydrogenase